VIRRDSRGIRNRRFLSVGGERSIISYAAINRERGECLAAADFATTGKAKGATHDVISIKGTFYVGKCNNRDIRTGIPDNVGLTNRSRRENDAMVKLYACLI